MTVGRCVATSAGQAVHATRPPGRFALRMGWREARGGFRHFTTFFVCVALGVTALIAVGTLGASLDATVAREAKTLLGGDIELRSARPLDAAVDRRLEPLKQSGGAVARVREMVAMARQAGGRSLLVEVKAVDSHYPLYGTVRTAEAASLGDLLRAQGAVVDQDLLDRLGLGPGDAIDIGAARFVIRGVILHEPDRATQFVSLGPRVLIADDALDRTELLRLGSRVRYRTLLRLPAAQGARSAREELARDLTDLTVRIVAYDEAQPGLRRSFAQLTTYLGLVGLASLMVGGIGVASATAAFIKRRRATIAILKCLGAESSTIVHTYLGQSLLIGLLASVAGAIVALTLQPLLLRLVAGLLPVPVAPRIDVGVLGRGLAMGGLTTALCAGWPLLAIREVRPSLLLRRDVVDSPPRIGFERWLVAIPIGAGLSCLAWWQAGDLRVAAIFIGGTAAALLLLSLLARTLVTLERSAVPFVAHAGFAWKQGIAALRRPGGHVTGIVVALGTGAMLLVAIQLLEGGLRRQLNQETRRETPSFFFIEVQPDQREAFAAAVAQAVPGIDPHLTPVVRARLASVNGIPVSRELVEQRRAKGDDRTWYFTRDYMLTWAAEPPSTNALTRGRWWTPTEAAALRASRSKMRPPSTWGSPSGERSPSTSRACGSRRR